jgi:exodeoxyribonuclease VII small subunit
MASVGDSEKAQSQDNPRGMAETSFEEAFNRLAETVQALESGGLTLEEATGLYEEGMRLVQLCNRLLSTAELRVTHLKDTYSDDPDPRPAFSPPFGNDGDEDEWDA